MFESIINWIKNLLFRKQNKLKIGFYGSPNAGKTSLANRICLDFGQEPVGQVSIVPHETRAIQKREQLTVKLKNCTLNMDILDMPGVAVKVDYRTFLNYGLSIEDAQQRAREATKGIIEALKELEKLDAALVVIDSTKDPISQTNITLLGNLESRDVPTILVANKIDLEDSNTKKIIENFPDYQIVEISALTGENTAKLYEAIAAEVNK